MEHGLFVAQLGSAWALQRELQMELVRQCALIITFCWQ